MTMKSVLALTALSVLGTANANAAPPAKYTESVLYSFTGSPDGQVSFSNLIDVNGTLYGTTYDGGASNWGTVFSINPGTGAETVLYSFQNNGIDGISPRAGLLNVNGTLYGTTTGGGASGNGTVYAINPGTGAETVVYSFASGMDAQIPVAGVINVKGTLYGTTEFGGASGDGAVYALNLGTGVEKVLHSFAGGTDGATPFYGTLVNLNGKLYGTTGYGGAFGHGTAFSVNPKTGAEAVLWSFGSGTDGQLPRAGLIKVKGTLYGTTAGGGANGDGTVFSLDPATGAETVLWSFAGGTDGSDPNAGLIHAGSTLYGTTFAGGVTNTGTVFALNPATSVETVLYSFSGGTDAANPFANLLNVNGSLYGTTQHGGTDGAGTVFALTKK